jgi:hypothetical protein
LFHRYFHRVSLYKANVWSAAMACTLLASKLHDNVKVSPSQVVEIFYLLYGRRILIMGCASNTTLRDKIAAHPSVSYASLPERCFGAKSEHSPAPDRLRTFLDAPLSQLSPTGPVFEQWSGAVIDAENDVLRQLGFVVYWITGSLAHKYLPYYLDLLLGGADEDLTTPRFGVSVTKEQVAQRAWSYCNDSYRLDLSTRFHASVVACAAIHLSLLDAAALGTGREMVESRSLPTSTTNCDERSYTAISWWGRLAETDSPEAVHVVCNALLGLQDSFDTKVAAFGFISSVSGQSFNDRGSSSWDRINEHVSTRQGAS